jgi:hypothetical protein
LRRTEEKLRHVKNRLSMNEETYYKPVEILSSIDDNSEDEKQDNADEFKTYDEIEKIKTKVNFTSETHVQPVTTGKMNTFRSRRRTLDNKSNRND